jgi:hypothetical protein
VKALVGPTFRFRHAKAEIAKAGASEAVLDDGVRMLPEIAIALERGNASSAAHSFSLP